MGEWSDYFEDFPEENPGNWVNGQFNPQAASRKRAEEEKIARDQANLDAEIKSIIEKHKQK